MHLQDELTGYATLKTVLTRYVQCVLSVNELPGWKVKDLDDSVRCVKQNENREFKVNVIFA